MLTTKRLNKNLYICSNLKVDCYVCEIKSSWVQTRQRT